MGKAITDVAKSKLCLAIVKNLRRWHLLGRRAAAFLFVPNLFYVSV